jgi:hypothetical protein
MRDYDVRRNGNAILLGISTNDAALDIVTSDATLRLCVELLQMRLSALATEQIGDFGIYPATLVVDSGDMATITVDGPEFEPARNLTAGICIEKRWLLQVLLEVVGTAPKAASKRGHH